MPPTRRQKHYLISLPIPGGFTHCFVMSNDRDIVERASQKLMYETEQRIGSVQMPVLLSTGPLSRKDVKIVRSVIGPEADQAYAKATDFHLTIWAMAKTDPMHDHLMALH